MDNPDERGEKRAVSEGALWSAADFWLQQTSQLLTFIVVGSLLGPRVVGVMTMALSGLLFLTTFITGGFADTLIQRATLRKDHFDTAFWLLLGAGVTAALLLAGSAPLISWIFSEPELSRILPVLALSLPFIGVSASFQGMLQRELRFRQLAMRSMIAYSTGFAVAVALAWLSYGIWSLVASLVVSRFLDALLIAFLSGVRPGRRITRAALSDIVDFGKHRVGTQLMGFIGLQVDRILIGIVLGPVALGLYSIAERIVIAFFFGVTGVIQRVAFPALSRRQVDRPRFDHALREFMTFGQVMSLPIFAGIAVTSYEAIAVILPESWLPAALPLAVLSLAALAHPTTNILTTATNALGRSDMVLRYSVVVIVLRVIASLVAVQVSMPAVAFAHLAINLITPAIVIKATDGIFGGKWRYYLGASWTVWVAGLLLIAMTLGAGVLFAGLEPVALLALKIAVGAASYVLALWLLAPNIYRGAIAFITARA